MHITRLRSSVLRRLLPAVLTFLLTLSLLLPSVPARAAGGWQWANPLPQGNDLLAVAYGGGRYVAVGAQGAVVTSTDGHSWSSVDAGTTARLLAVTYGGGRFIAAGAGTVISSTDGLHWVAAAKLDSGFMPGAAAYGGGRFVLVGTTGGTGLIAPVGGKATILSSADGVTWAGAEGVAGRALVAVTYGGGRLVAVGEGGDVLSSVDAQSWTAATVPGPAMGLASVAWGAGKFVAVSPDKGELTSSDGLTWEVAPRCGLGDNVIAFGQGQFVLTGTKGFCTAPDGKDWSMNMREDLGINAMAAGGPLVAVGAKGGLFTLQGYFWASENRSASRDLYAVAFGGGRYLAAGDGAMLTSPDGAAWTVGRGNRNGMADVAYGAGRFVAVGDCAISSTDGQTWSGCQGGYTTLFKGAASGAVVVYAGGQFVALGPVSATSADGVTWKPASLPGHDATGTWTSIGYDGSRYAAMKSCTLNTSTDGRTWTRSSATGPWARSGECWLTYTGGQWVETGAQGSVYTSPDLSAWTEHPLGQPVALWRVRTVAGQLRALTTTGNQLWGSSDGSTWSLLDRLPLVANLTDVAGDGSRQVVVGPGGAILTDGPTCAQPGAPASCQPVTVPPPAATDLSGTVKSTAGEAVAGAQVRLTGGPAPLATETDQLGHFRFAAVPAGLQLTLSVTAPGYVDQSLPVSVANHQPALADVTMTPAPSTGSRFRDMDHHWAAADVAALVDAGLISGFEDDTFRPDLPVTRAQFAKLVVLALGLPVPDTAPAFADAGKIPDWARGYVAAATQVGLISGYEDHTFRPDQPITRLQAAVILSRAMQRKGAPAPAPAKSFSDRSQIPDWAQPAVASVTGAGVMAGYEDNSFRPAGITTRAQAAVMIRRLRSQ